MNKLDQLKEKCRLEIIFPFEGEYYLLCWSPSPGYHRAILTKRLDQVDTVVSRIIDDNKDYTPDFKTLERIEIAAPSSELIQKIEQDFLVERLGHIKNSLNYDVCEFYRRHRKLLPGVTFCPNYNFSSFDFNDKYYFPDCTCDACIYGGLGFVINISPEKLVEWNWKPSCYIPKNHLASKLSIRRFSSSDEVYYLANDSGIYTADAQSTAVPQTVYFFFSKLEELNIPDKWLESIKEKRKLNEEKYNNRSKKMDAEQVSHTEKLDRNLLNFFSGDNYVEEK